MAFIVKANLLWLHEHYTLKLNNLAFLKMKHVFSGIFMKKVRLQFDTKI